MYIAPSSSSRRTWIEIIQHFNVAQCFRVVLLAEDVDRNFEPLRT